MDRDFAHFQDKFLISDLALTQVGSVIISLRPQQVTLGSMVVSLAEPRSNFADLDRGEAADLVEAIALADHLAKGVLGAQRLNVLFLMMVDPFVHAHCLPRYAEAVYLAGQEWIDDAWPGPTRLDPIPMPSATNVELLTLLRAEVDRVRV